MHTFTNLDIAFEDLLKKVTRYSGGEVSTPVQKAIALAQSEYVDAVHPSGDTYIRFSLNVAQILANLRADATTIAAALVYQVVSMKPEFLHIIEKELGVEVGQLVEDVNDFDKLEWDVLQLCGKACEKRVRNEAIRNMFSLALATTFDLGQTLDSAKHNTHFQKPQAQQENLIKMFLAEPSDTRSLIIRLADRLCILQTLHGRPEAAGSGASNGHVDFARIVLTLYAPLAERLGIGILKAELEDAAFQVVDPAVFEEISRQLQSRKEVQEKYLEQIVPAFRKALNEFGVHAVISSRVKHVYSIYRKMQAKELSLSQINDLLGVRIIVASEADCYMAQSIIHMHWAPATEFYDGNAGRDWIAKEKLNKYQSLHTTVWFEGKSVEVQIRTRRMHRIAEYGAVAAHWLYKEDKGYRKGKVRSHITESDRAWNKQLTELRDGLEERTKPAQTEKANPLMNRVFAMTPLGHVVELQLGATPIDFAYRIHTELGHHCVRAKVNGLSVRLDHQLQNGDLVEIETSSARKGPHEDWLGGGYVRTLSARYKIRSWLNRQKLKHTDR